MRRHCIQESKRQITMRIDYGEAAACPHVLQRERLDEGRLARAGLSYDVHVKKAIYLFDAECTMRQSAVGHREVGDVRDTRHQHKVTHARSSRTAGQRADNHNLLTLHQSVQPRTLKRCASLTKV